LLLSGRELGDLIAGAALCPFVEVLAVMHGVENDLRNLQLSLHLDLLRVE
jgi:hypothetical protein